MERHEGIKIDKLGKRRERDREKERKSDGKEREREYFFKCCHHYQWIFILFGVQI